MKYFQLQVPKDNNAAYLVSKPSDAKKSFFANFTFGTPAQGKVPPLSATTSPDCGNKFLDAIANVHGDLIVSDRLLNVFKSLGLKNVESFPVTVIDNETGAKHQYWICNAVGTIRCIDKKRSKVIWDDDDPTQAFRVKKLVVDPKAIEAVNKARGPADQLRLFRLEERPLILLASEEVEDAVTAAGITGVEFSKV